MQKTFSTFLKSFFASLKKIAQQPPSQGSGGFRYAAVPLWPTASIFLFLFELANTHANNLRASYVILESQKVANYNGFPFTIQSS